MIRKWLDRRKVVKEHAEFQRGWDWAAGRMLSGEWTEAGLQNYAANLTYRNGEQMVLNGVLAACAKMRTLEVTAK